MGEKTNIAWCDHSWNPWIGCTKVSAGCAHCYAETENKRFNWTTGWGPGFPRRRTSPANWKQPLKWAENAIRDGVTRRVFCASLADVFEDNTSLNDWRVDLWAMITQTYYTGGLEWLILTKRPENIERMFPRTWQQNPPDFIRLGVTVENQDNVKRVTDLLRVWKGKNFISAEPLLGPVKLFGFASPTWGKLPENAFLHWVICGGESGPNARPMNPDWARSLRDQCQEAGVPYFHKQNGEWAVSPNKTFTTPQDGMTGPWTDGHGNKTYMIGDGVSTEHTVLERVGKKAAGRLLDGRVWAEFPEVK